MIQKFENIAIMKSYLQNFVENVKSSPFYQVLKMNHLVANLVIKLIFFLSLDKSSVPQQTLTPCKDNSDFCILRIHAGPPYEDIAFKIVNREWEYGYKRGFRCQFQNNIFQLWFHFKRLRYRR